MDLTIISDTHLRHQEFGSLQGQVLIHCGDMFQLHRSSQQDLQDIDDWFGRQAFDLILVIGGNHDIPLEDKRRISPQPFKNALYLEDDAHDYQGVVFYGAPWVPKLTGHAFYQDEGDLMRKWTTIPDSTDVLITHAPPAGILDESSYGFRYGCEHLLSATRRIAPRIHCFGHVHASAGIEEHGTTRFVNASSFVARDEPLRPPLEISL